MDQTSPSSSYPLVVVGAGAAGLYLASRLADRRSLLLLESGPARGVQTDDPRNAVHTEGPYSHGQSGRARGLGGTTNLWGGQMLPFTAHDLTPDKGWPLHYAELQPYYDAVSRILLGESSDYGSPAARRTGQPLLSLKHEAFRVHLSKWLANPRFRQILLPRLGPGVNIRSDCTVTGIEPLAMGGYQLHCRSSTGAPTCIRAEQLVLATGTIETIRLLLVSREQFGLPVSTALGQGFMDHVSVDVCQLLPSRRFRLQRRFNTRRAGRGIRYSVRMSATPDWLQKTGHLNASAMVVVRPPRSRWQQLVNVLSAGCSTLVGRFIYKLFGPIMLNVMVEQSPTVRERQISLAPDQFPYIRWYPTLEEAATARALATEVTEALFQQGWLREQPRIPTTETLLARLEDVCHPMGGAAMHVSAARQVVSPQLEVISCPHLYVASAAVFPSGSHSNPTMTLLALTHRLAEQLKSHSNCPDQADTGCRP